MIKNHNLSVKFLFFFSQGIQGNIGRWGEEGPRGPSGGTGLQGPVGPDGVTGYPVSLIFIIYCWTSFIWFH